VLTKLTNDLRARFWNADGMTPIESDIFNHMLLRRAREQLGRGP